MPVYLKPADLLAEVKRAQSLEQITPKLGEMFLLMVENYIKKGNWNGYSYRDDMVGHAMVSLCNAAFKFNPEKSNNAFSYYTSVIHHAFIQVLKYEGKHRDTRDALLLDAGLDPSHSYVEKMEKKQAADKAKQLLKHQASDYFLMT